MGAGNSYFTDDHMVAESLEVFIKNYRTLEEEITISTIHRLSGIEGGLNLSCNDWENFLADNNGSISKLKLKELYDTRRLHTFHDIDERHIQQPINACNITSLAYAFSVVTGNEITVNDIFHIARINGSYVTFGGLTLAQTFDIASVVASSLGGLFVEIYHFDSEVVDFDGFKNAIIDDIVNTDDQLICNFSVKIAHQVASGGGHYSLVGCIDINEENAEELSVTMCEVHPLKYGKTWSCSARHMFEAMVDKDSDSKRARGLIRIGKDLCDRGIPSLIKAKKAVCFCDSAVVGSNPLLQPWLERFSRWLPADQFLQVLNMSGVTAAGLAITGLLGKQDFSFVGPDHIMRKLRLDYTKVLFEVATSSDVLMYITEYTSRCSLPFTAYEMDFTDINYMIHYLSDVVGPSNGDNIIDDTVAVVLFDLNIALGTEIKVMIPGTEASQLSHLSANWAVIVRLDPITLKVIIADPSSMTTTRLWEVDPKTLWEAMVARKSTSVMITSITNVSNSLPTCPLFRKDTFLRSTSVI
eukprot:gene16921-23224_t